MYIHVRGGNKRTAPAMVLAAVVGKLVKDDVGLGGFSCVCRDLVFEEWTGIMMRVEEMTTLCLAVQQREERMWWRRKRD